LKLLVLVGSSFSGKATFIAAVQAQVITYAYQNNSTALEVTINAIFFTGLFLDIVGGCMA
jgi:predicted kinase